MIESIGNQELTQLAAEVSQRIEHMVNNL